MNERGRSSAGLALALAAVLCHCSGRAPEAPAAVAVAAVELAARRPLEEGRVAQLFAVGAAGTDRVALLDALDTVTPGKPKLTALEWREGEPEAFADVALEGPSGSHTAYRMKLVLVEHRWRVVWLAGPGIEWPARRARADAALSVSSHASDAGER